MKNYPLFALLSFILTACGQYGPLFLPPPDAPTPPAQVEKPKAQTATPPASMPTSSGTTK
jgi:predicted small lipoprotein YifL